jgi:hypothetical protein
VAAIGSWLVYLTGSWWFLILVGVPLLLAAWRLYGVILLGIARLRWVPQGIRGVLVYSDSPNWQEHIETHWLPSFGTQFRVLNWSRRKEWKPSLEVRLFLHYCGVDRNFNPSVVLLRGLRHPLVFRFFYAFQEAKHGKPAVLHSLEQRLFRELHISWSARDPSTVA